MGIVTRNRKVVAGSPLRLNRILEIARAGQYVENAGCVTPDGNVAHTVAVIVVLSTEIGPCKSETSCDKGPIRTAQNVPDQIRARGRAFAYDRKISLAVAVVVTWDDEVIAQAPVSYRQAGIAAE